MSVKRFLLLSILILILCFPSLGEKKQESLSLSELKDPNGPSYVPAPYPKSRKEIIIDLLYAVEYHFGPNKKSRKYVIRSNEEEIMSKLLGDKPELHVGKIITSKNKTTSRADEYIVMDIIDSSGVVAARVSLEDCGLFAGAGFATKSFPIRPLMSLSDARDFFNNSRIPKLAGANVLSIEYESFGGTSTTKPYLKIKSDSGTFYMDARNKVFEFMEKKQFASDNELLEFLKDLHAKYSAQNVKQPYYEALVSENTLEALLTKAVE